MEIKVGDLVSIRHFSGTKLFKSLVLESNNDEVLLETYGRHRSSQLFNW